MGRPDRSSGSTRARRGQGARAPHPPAARRARSVRALVRLAALAPAAGLLAVGPLRSASAAPTFVRPAPAAVRAAATAPSAPPATGRPTPRGLARDEARALVAEIGELMRTQRPDGLYAPGDALRFYTDVPLVATLALEATRRVRAPAFTARAAASIERWYRARFSRDDTDGDLLVEHVGTDDDGTPRRIVSPGECALMALDLGALSGLYLELRRPIAALYWYDGARALRRAVVSATFDPDAGAFRPFVRATGHVLRRRDALDLAPALFDGVVGPNHAARLAASIDRAGAWPGAAAPAHWIDAACGAGRADPLTLARVAVVVGLLERARPDRAADAAGRLVRRPPPLDAPAGHAAVAPAAARALWRIAVDRGGLHPDASLPLRIVGAVARARRALPDVDLVRFDGALERVVAILDGRVPADADGAVAAVRETFSGLSALRDVLARTELFTSQDRYELSGVPARPAMERVLADALDAVRAAENAVSAARRASERLGVDATLLDERAVPGDAVTLRWRLHVGARPLAVRRLVAHVGDAVDTLRATPVTLRPGAAPLEVAVRIPVHAEHIPTLVSVRATLEVIDASGRRTRHHVRRTVWLEPPVSARLSMPEGPLLGDVPLPLDVEFLRRVDHAVTVTCAWRSVAGLLLREGPLTRVVVDADTVRARFHVLPTRPLRPGTFPFTMAFGVGRFGAGAVHAQLVRPFRWIAVGPFARRADPMRVRYPPERSVDLLGSWSGDGGRVRWRPLPPAATRDDGWVEVGPLLGDDGVAFLYTVVRAEAPLELPVRLECTGVARVTINGRRVVEATRVARGTPAPRVTLRAGLNDVLVKVAGDRSTRVRLTLGEPGVLAPDALDNDVATLLDGYGELVARQRGRQAVAVRRTVVLRYEDATARSVSVIGTFNGWSPRSTPMRHVGPGRWEATLSLEPGRYAYRFLVDDRRQVLDPSSPLREPDGFGGENSVLVVGP